MAVLSITPARLARLRDPFDHPDWLFEIKHDGFRGLAFVERGAARLASSGIGLGTVPPQKLSRPVFEPRV